jgi:hypothetical protein
MTHFTDFSTITLALIVMQCCIESATQFKNFSLVQHDDSNGIKNYIWHLIIKP